MSPNFNYYAKDVKGEDKKGLIEALNKEDAISKLQKQGLFIISIEIVGGEEEELAEKIPEPTPAGIPVQTKNLDKNFLVVIGTFLLVFIILTAGLLTYFSAKKKFIYKTKLYEVKLSGVSSRITVDTYGSLIVAEGVSAAWNSGIDSGGESGMTFAKLKIEDWLDKAKDQINGLKDSNEKIEQDMQMLRECPAQYKDAYNALIELYGIYSQIYSLALNPSGSLQSFNNKIHDLKSDFDNKSSKLKLFLP